MPSTALRPFHNSCGISLSVSTLLLNDQFNHCFPALTDQLPSWADDTVHVHVQSVCRGCDRNHLEHPVQGVLAEMNKVPKAAEKVPLCTCLF